LDQHRPGARATGVIAGILLGVTACGHYRTALPVPEPLRGQVRADLAVGAIVDRHSGGTAGGEIAGGATRSLVERAQGTDVSGQLTDGELALLLSAPSDLAMRAGELSQLRERLGRRYVLVGERGSQPVNHVLFWDALIVIPAPYVTVWFTIPIPVSREPGVPHATRVLRVIDLAEAAIVAESYELLRDRPDEGEFSAGQVRAGLRALEIDR
jgi:hypothetical protein